MKNDHQGRQLEHALVQRIQRLRSAGSAKRAIARALGLSYNTVAKYSNPTSLPDTADDNSKHEDDTPVTPPRQTTIAPHSQGQRIRTKHNSPKTNNRT